MNVTPAASPAPGGASPLTTPEQHLLQRRVVSGGKPVTRPLPLRLEPMPRPQKGFSPHDLALPPPKVGTGIQGQVTGTWIRGEPFHQKRTMKKQNLGVAASADAMEDVCDFKNKEEEGDEMARDNDASFVPDLVELDDRTILHFVMHRLRQLEINRANESQVLGSAIAEFRNHVRRRKEEDRAAWLSELSEATTAPVADVYEGEGEDGEKKEDEGDARFLEVLQARFLTPQRTAVQRARVATAPGAPKKRGKRKTVRRRLVDEMQ